VKIEFNGVVKLKTVSSFNDILNQIKANFSEVTGTRFNILYNDGKDNI